MNGRLIIPILIGILATGRVASEEDRSGLFPLGKSWVGDRELPRPFGVGINYHYQKQNYDLIRLSVTLPSISLPPVEAADLKVDNWVREIHLTADLWLLPFLNLFGLIGRIDGETKVIVEPPFDDFMLEYNGVVYGGGANLAMGLGRFFSSLSGIYTQTDLDLSDSSTDAWVLTPKFGMHGRRGAFWVGTMYQEIDERHKGKATIPVLGDVDFDVELDEKDSWSYLAGVRTKFRQHWGMDLEGSVGNRKQMTAFCSYRF